MKTGYIYKITSPTGGVYIGKTFWLSKRFTSYKTLKCKGQRRVYNSIVKHGWENHKFEVLFEKAVDNITLSEMETFYIVHHNSYSKWNPCGMNLTLGGDGCRIEHHTEETKKKISASKTGKPKTEAQKAAHLKMFGRKIDKHPEWIKNNSEARKKPLAQYTLDDVWIANWKSAQDVEDTLGFCRKNLSSCLRNKTVHAYGYKWKYITKTGGEL